MRKVTNLPWCHENGNVTARLASYTLLDLSSEIGQSVVDKVRDMTKHVTRFLSHVARGVMTG